jgi:hypothetical protein
MAEFSRANPVLMSANIVGLLMTNKVLERDIALTLDMRDWIIHTIKVLALDIPLRIRLAVVQPLSTL